MNAENQAKQSDFDMVKELVDEIKTVLSYFDFDIEQYRVALTHEESTARISLCSTHVCDLGDAVDKLIALQEKLGRR